jgi:hypothetical protein
MGAQGKHPVSGGKGLPETNALVGGLKVPTWKDQTRLERFAIVKCTCGGSRCLPGKIVTQWERLARVKHTCGGSRCLPGKIGLSGKGLPE